MSTSPPPDLARPAKRRSWWWVGAAFLPILVAAHTAIWWFVSGQIERQLPSAVEGAKLYGWHVEAGEPVRTGWPWMATVRLPSVRATRSMGEAPLRWTAERIDVSVSPLRPFMIELAPSGAQTIAVPGGATLPFHADRMLARVPLSGGPIEFVAEMLDAGSAAAGVRVQSLTGAMEAQKIGVRASGITLSPALAAPFDGPSKLTATGSTNTAFPVAATPGASAAAWRDAGGRVELTALTLRWGKLLLEGGGTGGLDAQLQPEGRLGLRVQGALETLDAMARGGLVGPGPASAGRAVMGLLTASAHGGPVTLPVALKGRVLTVTQFPVLRLPVLDWNMP